MITSLCVVRFTVGGCVCVINCKLLHDHISLCDEVYYGRLCMRVTNFKLL